MDWTRKTTAIVGGLFLVIVGTIVAVAFLGQHKTVAEPKLNKLVTGTWTCEEMVGQSEVPMPITDETEINGDLIWADLGEKELRGQFMSKTTLTFNIIPKGRDSNLNVEVIDCWVGDQDDRPW